MIRSLAASTITQIRKFRQDDCAATAVEYALLLGLIMVSCISAILSTGDVQDALWFNTASTLEVINSK